MEITFKSYKLLCYKDFSFLCVYVIPISYHTKRMKLAKSDSVLKGVVSYTVGLNFALYNYSFCYT